MFYVRLDIHSTRISICALNQAGYDQGSRVEIYDQVVVVTTKNGLSHVYPQGGSSGLVIKRD
jgi:hypothetical protein